MRPDWIPIASSDNVDFNSRHCYWHSQKHQSQKTFQPRPFFKLRSRLNFQKLAYLLDHVCLSAERICKKFHFGKYLLKFEDRFHFSAELDNISGHLAYFSERGESPNKQVPIVRLLISFKKSKITSWRTRQICHAGHSIS